MIYFFILFANELDSNLVKLVNLQEGALIKKVDDDSPFVTVQSDKYVYVIKKDDYNYYILNENRDKIIYQVSSKYLGFFDKDEFDIDVAPTSFKTYHRPPIFILKTLLELGLTIGWLDGLANDTYTTSFDVEVFDNFFIGPSVEYFSLNHETLKWSTFLVGVNAKYLFKYSDFSIVPKFSYLAPIAQRIGAESDLNTIEMNNASSMNIELVVYHKVGNTHNLGLGIGSQQFFSKEARMTSYHINFNYMRGFDF